MIKPSVLRPQSDMSASATEGRFGEISPKPAVYPTGEGGNITPMIDVLLVLLVIFMAALPLSQRGIDASLPAETREATAPPVPPDQIVLEYSAERQLASDRCPRARSKADRRRPPRGVGPRERSSEPRDKWSVGCAGAVRV